MEKVDVIIPVYRPDKRLLTLIERLNKQTEKINQIIIVNTEQKYFETLILGTSFWEKYKNVKVIHISKKEFDHGKSRNLGVKQSQTSYFLFLTQDALPLDENLISPLLNTLENNKKVAVAYGRQLPAEDAGIIERYTREFNYPAEPRIKTQADMAEMGIKTFFCSNVCAMYRKEIFTELGGFINHTIFNEDMIYAGGAVKAGYGIAYVPQAQVIHSHNYTGGQQLKRNFDLGVSQADHPEIFEGIASESEGIKLVKRTAAYLIHMHKSHLVVKLIYQSGCKYIGFWLGKNYRKLSAKTIARFTMNPEYWK